MHGNENELHGVNWFGDARKIDDLRKIITIEENREKGMTTI